MERVPYRATAGCEPYDGLRLPVSVLLHDVRSMYNVGAFFRTGNGAGVERIYLSGITGRPPSSAIAKTALGAETCTAWEGLADPMETIGGLRQRSYEIVAIETSLRAVDLFDWQPRFPVCVLFGHEVTGLPECVLESSDTHIRIPMLGMKHSLNVASAGAVVLYELLRKYRRLRRRDQ